MNKEIKLPNRAYTNEQKQEVMERLLVQWKRIPELRLGQLIVNVVQVSHNLFNEEDFTLCEQVEAFADRVSK